MNNNCKICYTFLNKKDEEDTKEMDSCFNEEIKICPKCYTAEQLVLITKDPDEKAKISFAKIIKSFDIWRELVLEHMIQSEELREVRKEDIKSDS